MRVTSTAAAVAPSAVASAMPSATVTPALAACVNGEPIFLVEYERQVAGRLSDIGPGSGLTATLPSEGDTPALEQQVLEEMIDLILVEQAAEELGVVPGDAEVEAQVQADVAAGGGASAFEAWLASTGQTEQSYRAAVRSSLILQRVALAVTADVGRGAPGDEAVGRAEAFERWLAERRDQAMVERWVGR